SDTSSRRTRDSNPPPTSRIRTTGPEHDMRDTASSTTANTSRTRQVPSLRTGTSASDMIREKHRLERITTTSTTTTTSARVKSPVIKDGDRPRSFSKATGAFASGSVNGSRAPPPGEYKRG